MIKKTKNFQKILMKTDLLILCATLSEIGGFISHFPSVSKKLFPSGPVLFSGEKEGKNYDLLISGPGVFNTVHALTAYLEHSSCSIILHTGIAGVFKEAGLNIGDLAVASDEQYIHTGVAVADKAFLNAALPFELIDSVPSTREGRYYFDSDLTDRFYKYLFHNVSNDLSVKVAKGAFITVSTITGTQDMAGRIYSAFSPVMESMEGAAAAHVAALYNVPVIEFRAVSNFVGERDKTKWDIDKAVRQIENALANCLPEFL